LNDTSNQDVDVAIIGGGFAGMNTARLLAKKGINCKIIDAGNGASNFWLGTVDVLNYPGDNLILELAKFQVSLPAHPYSHISMEILQKSLQEFYESFPTFSSFQDSNAEVCNGHVLTSLGNTKLTTGKWNTIFSNFGKLTEESVCLLINFQEFTNSPMALIAKGLEEKFQGQFLVLTVSLRQLFQQMNADLMDNMKKQVISVKTIAKFFDEKAIHMSPLATLIKSNFATKFPEIDWKKISLVLFPPIMGIENCPTIFTHLSSHLGIECFETVALTPSIMAERFLRQFQRKIQVLAIPFAKKTKMVDLTKNDSEWIVHLVDSHGNTQKLKTKYIVIAVGSLFTQGLFSESYELGNKFHQLELDFPDSIDSNYEIISTTQKSNIFVVGASNYLFSTDLSEEDEVRDGTGLGVAIATSFKVAEVIQARIKEN